MNPTPKKSEKKQHRCHGFKILDLGSKNSYLIKVQKITFCSNSFILLNINRIEEDCIHQI